jgi:lysophospholipase L1-like esterase
MKRLSDGTTLLFTGDSITDCGRARPLGERDGLGEGYVAFVNGVLAVRQPEVSIRILNTGIGGNRVTDLEGRWDDDVLAYQPNWLSVLIGINDVWRHFDWHMHPNQVAITRFEEVYRQLLVRTRPTLDGLVLMTPYFIELRSDDPMRVQMDAYGAVVQRLAEEFDAVFVDLQSAFNRVLAHRPSQSLAGDRVHPNKTGHLIIAEAFLEAVGS